MMSTDTHDGSVQQSTFFIGIHTANTGPRVRFKLNPVAFIMKTLYLSIVITHTDPVSGSRYAKLLNK